MPVTQTINEHVLEEEKSAKTVMSGSVAESIGSIAAIVLTIISLAGFYASILLPVATIVVGAAFLLEGGAISLRFSKLLEETSRDRFDQAEFGVGLSSEFLGGIAGVVLGILALLGLAPVILAAIAVLVYGSVLMMSSGLTLRLNALEVEGGEVWRFRRIAHAAMEAAAGVNFLSGLTVVILGIIALTGTHAAMLSLIGLLIVAVSSTFSGTALTTRMASFFRGR